LAVARGCGFNMSSAGLHTFPQMLFEGRYIAAHRRIVDHLRGPRMHGPECEKI
jgi:hypothetical protein